MIKKLGALAVIMGVLAIAFRKAKSLMGGEGEEAEVEVESDV